MTVTTGLVSTIIPVYNRPRLLAEAVTSALAQTYRPIEIVIVDDGSTDSTAEVAAAFADQHPDVVRYIRQVHEGYCRAINNGLRNVRGEFVQFLDSDDVLMPEKFALQVSGLQASPECGISYGYVREYVLGERWSGRPARRSGERFGLLFPAILSGKIWPTPAPLFRREVIEASGLFCELSIYPEWEYECRAAARGVRLHHCPQFVADFRGTHHLEGRKKGGAPVGKLRDYAEALERVLGHARDARVAPPHLDQFSRRLFAVARQCANAGFEPEARRCLDLARGAATAPINRLGMSVYRATSNQVGWTVVGRCSERAERSDLAGAIRAARRWPAAFSAQWRHRARVALATIAGQPLLSWPSLLAQRWSHRQSRQRFNP